MSAHNNTQENGLNRILTPAQQVLVNQAEIIKQLELMKFMLSDAVEARKEQLAEARTTRRWIVGLGVGILMNGIALLLHLLGV